MILLYLRDWENIAGETRIREYFADYPLNPPTQMATTQLPCLNGGVYDSGLQRYESIFLFLFS
jgi:hypothetical protein